eukprot:12826689-Alexandrium_andersonii.AAC.1
MQRDEEHLGESFSPSVRNITHSHGVIFRGGSRKAQVSEKQAGSRGERAGGGRVAVGGRRVGRRAGAFARTVRAGRDGGA